MISIFQVSLITALFSMCYVSLKIIKKYHYRIFVLIAEECRYYVKGKFSILFLQIIVHFQVLIAIYKFQVYIMTKRLSTCWQ